MLELSSTKYKINIFNLYKQLKERIKYMMKKNLSKSGDRFKKQNKTKITIDTNIQTKAMLRVNKVYKELKIN